MNNESERYMLYTDYYSRGIVVNIASRLCTFAAPKFHFLEHCTIGYIKDYCKANNINIRKIGG